MSYTFVMPIIVRGYELDSQGHLHGAVYLQYGDHVRWESFRAAGISIGMLREMGVGPVVLETTIQYHQELKGGDEAEMSCSYLWDERKTVRVSQDLRRTDGTLAAKIISTAGLMDLKARRLVQHPATRLRSLATAPHIIGL